MKKTSLYLDPDLDEALARRAADEGLTKAEFIRRTLAARDAEAEAAEAARRHLPQQRWPESSGAIGQEMDGLRRGLTVVLDTTPSSRSTTRRRPRHHERSPICLRRLDEDLVTTPLAAAPRWTTSPTARGGHERRDALWQDLDTGAYAVRWWADALSRDARDRPSPSVRSASPTRRSSRWRACCARTASSTFDHHFRSLTTPRGEPFVVLPDRRLKGP